jgi:hypothetical protein
MLTYGEHFLYFLNLLPALNALVCSARLNDKKMRLLMCFSSRVLLAKNLLGSLFYVVEDFSGYRVLVLLTTVVRHIITRFAKSLPRMSNRSSTAL